MTQRIAWLQVCPYMSDYLDIPGRLYALLAKRKDPIQMAEYSSGYTIKSARCFVWPWAALRLDYWNLQYNV